mmetsp:Transcript_71512/g.140388  ORF Transcript_71512/g.140388 Transcript_71512/m.140388 type:complete len:545 (+) Transcript_71512:174-1808(+)
MIAGLNPQSFAVLLMATPGDQNSVASFMGTVLIPLLELALVENSHSRSVGSFGASGTEMAKARANLAEKTLKLYQVVRTQGEESFTGGNSRSSGIGATIERLASLLATVLAQTRRTVGGRDNAHSSCSGGTGLRESGERVLLPPPPPPLGPVPADLHRFAVQGLVFAADASIDGGREQKQITQALLVERDINSSDLPRPHLSLSQGDAVVASITEGNGSGNGDNQVEGTIVAVKPVRSVPTATEITKATTTALDSLVATLTEIVRALGGMGGSKVGSGGSVGGSGGNSGGAAESSRGETSTRRALHGELVPLLVVLTRAARASGEVLRRTKALVFPPAADARWQQRLAELRIVEDKLTAEEDSQVAVAAAAAVAAVAATDDNTITSDSSTGGGGVLAAQENLSVGEGVIAEVAALREARVKARRESAMRPVDVDAPFDSLRFGLCALITSLDSTVKRCVCEFLLALCSRDLDEFTLRCGYGNAAYMHHVQGALRLGETTTASAMRAPPPLKEREQQKEEENEKEAGAGVAGRAAAVAKAKEEGP